MKNQSLHPLQKRIVQLACDSLSFCEPLLESKISPRAPRRDSKIEGQRYNGRDAKAREDPNNYRHSVSKYFRAIGSKRFPEDSRLQRSQVWQDRCRRGSLGVRWGDEIEKEASWLIVPSSPGPVPVGCHTYRHAHHLTLLFIRENDE